MFFCNSDDLELNGEWKQLWGWLTSVKLALMRRLQMLQLSVDIYLSTIKDFSVKISVKT